METTFSPVIGISGETLILVVAVGTGTAIVAVGRVGCPAGGTVHTGVGDTRLSLPQADVKKIKINAPITVERDILLISKASELKSNFPSILRTYINHTNQSLVLL
jgi:hypothetical protein